MTDSALPRLAFIDSGNYSIQLPEKVFNNMLMQIIKESKSKENFIKFVVDIDDEGNKIMTASKPCKDIYDILKPITFKI